MENKFYKIGEISELLGLRSSTLRYWEKEFHQLKPVKSSGGQRFYTQRHIELLRKLQTLLYIDKLTIEGAKKRLKTHNNVAEEKENLQPTSATKADNDELKKELLEILSMLK